MSREEKTETIYGIENTVSVSLVCFARVKERHDTCGDDTLPSVIVMTEPIKNAYRELLRRGIKTRFISEITDKNIEYCKELIKIVHELRHLEGVKGNFAVGESDYIATATQQESRPIAQLIHSNARGMIEQQQYFFETLWDKAIPAEQRIREMEEGVEPEKTQVIYGAENVVRKNIECFSKAVKKLDVCHDSTGPSVVVSMKPILSAAADFVKRGGKIRFLTEITEKNIDNCKKLMETCEARHLDGVKGNFGVSEKDYLTMPDLQEGNILPQVIHSNIKGIIRQHQYLFETLWNKAIPARQRFKEIEQGAKTEFVETIRDPYEIQKLGFDLIEKAEEEILILFSTANAFRRQERAGALELLKGAVKLRGIKVRILVPLGDNDDNNDAISERIQQMKDSGIDIRAIKQTFQNKLSTLVIDQSLCLTVELKDDSKENSDEAIGLATYSNSEATVFSYVSIFENLWIQAQLHKKQEQQEAAAS